MSTYTAKNRGKAAKSLAGKSVFVANSTIDANISGEVLDSNGAVTTAKVVATDILEMIAIPANCVCLGGSLYVDRSPLGL